jgi:hypothetical protein
MFTPDSVSDMTQRQLVQTSFMLLSLVHKAAILLITRAVCRLCPASWPSSALTTASSRPARTTPC